MVTDSALATALAFHGQAMRVPKSAVIFEAGETADGIYIVRSGRVEVRLLNPHEIPVWSHIVPDSGILGLPAAIGRHAHHIRAVACDNSELIFVDAGTLSDVIRDDPKLGTQVLMLISEELSDLRRKAAMLNGRLNSRPSN